MFATKIKIAMIITLISLTAIGTCLMGYSSMQAGQSASTQPTLPQDKDAKPPEKDAGDKDPEKTDQMFPDGLEHDVGIVMKGTQAYHAFRIINTSDVPVRIISLRTS